MFDPKCFDLAEHFIATAPERVQDMLAQRIQTEIEVWLEENADLLRNEQGN